MNIKIEKLVFGGQGLGRVDNKAVFVWNALPGEEVEVELIKDKPNFAEGIARKIIKKSSDRLEPQEDHYLACSPWQIISFVKENEWKVEIAKETFKKFGSFEWPKLNIISDNNEFGYRNKMEYSFIKYEGKISLAFFERESRRHIPIKICELARPEINKVALELLVWINKNNISLDSLKSMIVRCNQKGEVIVGLFLKDRLQFKNYPELKTNFIGLNIFYSTQQSPVSVPTAVLYKVGQDFLEEELFGVKLCYGLFSFFQINIPIFKKALEDIKRFIDPDDNIIDYYSGVGAIGLSVSNVGANCYSSTLIESNPEAVEYAKINIKLNGLVNCEAICAPSEKMVDLIAADKTIIFDPPRAGLDKKVIERVNKTKPAKIIYLSCDLATQARDIGLLKENYNINFLKLYNFFPRTAHIEGLVVLQIKK